LLGVLNVDKFAIGRDALLAIVRWYLQPTCHVEHKRISRLNSSIVN
jgi:hypothetical protein